MTSLPINPQLTAGADPGVKPVKTYPRWPVLVLAASAFVAIWGGWVSLGRMCGFGPVNLLPGITDFQVDLSITLPLGMEVYAAYATGAWLSNRSIDHVTRMFAKWSSLTALFIGGAGQVTYHLLNAAHVQHAPTPVVSVVSCIPVVVLGMASQLAYRLTKHSKDEARAAATAAVAASAPVAEAAAAPEPAETPEHDAAPTAEEETTAQSDSPAPEAEGSTEQDVEAEAAEEETTAQLDVQQPDDGVEHTLQLDMEPHIGSMFYDQAAEMAASAPTSYETGSYEPASDIWSQINFGSSTADADRSQYLHPDADQAAEAEDAVDDGYQNDQSDEQDGADDEAQRHEDDDRSDDGRRSSHRGHSRGPLSDEERTRILELVGDGHSEREVSRKVGRSRATVHRVVTSEQQEDEDESEGQSQDDELELASAS